MLKSWKCVDAGLWRIITLQYGSSLSFLVTDLEIEVRTILESWRKPDYFWFNVETEDGGVYDLRHHKYEDFRQVREFRKLRSGMWGA